MSSRSKKTSRSSRGGSSMSAIRDYGAWSWAASPGWGGGDRARRPAELVGIPTQLPPEADLARRLDLVLSIPGIGERTALALLIRMPELGQVSREEAAALAGLAPFDDDSGQHRGQRHIAGGRSRLRRSLFAAALPAAYRWNKALIALYPRLKARGKAHNSALVACARKLLIYANTVVQRGTP